MSRFQYDIDEYGFDDFEYAMEDSDSGLFDKHTANEEGGVTRARQAGGGSVYEVPQPLDPRELMDESGELMSDTVDELLEKLPEAEVEELVIDAAGLPDVWQFMEDHNIYFNPYEDQRMSEKDRRRYEDDYGWEKYLRRKHWKVWWRNPLYYETNLTKNKQRMKARYYGATEGAKEKALRKHEAEKEKRREAARKRRANLTDEQRQLEKEKQRKRMEKLRAQRRAKK